MKIWFSQIYIEPGVDFPFSHFFQKRLSIDVTALVEPSAEFTRAYGEDFEIMFRISAKRSIEDNEIKGPTVFKKTRDLEYTVFLPFDHIMRHTDAPRVALIYLLKGVGDVFHRLGIDATNLLEKQESLIAGICADPAMLATASWDDEENETRGRKVFTEFFQTNKR